VKIREVNYPNPACCVPADTVQQAATIMRDFDIGSIPVVVDQQSRKLLGIITDRDLCCSVLAAGLDPKTTPIEKYVTLHPATCRDGDNVEKCERAMREHRLRRIPIVDAENRCIGIVALADVALRYKPECPGLWPRFPNLARKSQSQPEANVGLAIPIARVWPDAQTHASAQLEIEDNLRLRCRHGPPFDSHQRYK